MAGMTQQTQAEANVFWADKEYKKWVVEYSAGPLRRRRTGVAYVGAGTATEARKLGLTDMLNRGHTWAKSAAVRVRLARADDLGCVRTGVEGGAA